MLVQDANRKKFPNKGMNKETKATDKIGLVKTNLISIRVTSPFFVTRDANFHRIRELKPIPDSLLILSLKGIRDVSGFIRDGHRSGIRDHAIIRQG